MAVELAYAVQENPTIPREFPQKVCQNGHLDKTISTGFYVELQQYRTQTLSRNSLSKQQGLKYL